MHSFHLILTASLWGTGIRFSPIYTKGYWNSARLSHSQHSLWVCAHIVHSFHKHWLHTSRMNEGFPDGSVVKNLLANSGHTGLIPGPGRSYMPQSSKAHVPQLLSLCSRAWQLELLSPHTHDLQQKKPLQWEPRATREKPCSNKHSAQPKKSNQSINHFLKSLSKAQNLTLRSHIYFKGGDITNGYKTAWTLVRLAISWHNPSNQACNHPGFHRTALI